MIPFVKLESDDFDYFNLPEDDQRPTMAQVHRRLEEFQELIAKTEPAARILKCCNLEHSGPWMHGARKKGEHGAMFFSQHETYVLPAYPTPLVVDPTGAGDSFAGGMMGYLAEQDNFDPKTLKQAMAYGILIASFTVEDFSLDRLKHIERADLDRRMAEYKKMLRF